MNERTKTTSPEQGVLEKHDTLQTVQAPTASILAKSIKRGLHPVLQSQKHPRTTPKSGRRGLKAKRATITITKRTPEGVPEVSPAGEVDVQQGMEGQLEGGTGKS